MQTSKAAKLWIGCHKSNSKKNTVRAYKATLTEFCQDFGDKELEEVTLDEILSFLNQLTEGKKQQTKRTRYSHLLALFNFVKNNFDQNIQNPCNTAVLRILFRGKRSHSWDIIEKETMDEIIFRTSKPRNRLILELMARDGMKISEVLKLTPSDINF